MHDAVKGSRSLLGYGYPIFSAIVPLWDFGRKIHQKEVDDDDAEEV
jgi:hypothetical protein